MATKPDDHVKQQEVLVGLQKSGTLKKATVVHVSPADTSAQGTNTNNSSNWKPLSLEERRVVLSDNTQILVESQNEFVFIGPMSSKIVLSCLPLFSIPNQPDDSLVDQSPTLNFTPTSSAVRKSNGWISFGRSTVETKTSNPQPEPPEVDEVLPPEIPPIDQELPGDIFTLVDPFESETTDGFSGIEQSTRSQQIDDAFEKATNSVSGEKRQSEDERGYSDSDDNCVNDDDIHINFVPDVSAIKTRTASVSFVTMNQIPRSNTLIITSLPPPPTTKFPRYIERGGWLIKLSHQKGMFGDRWQKRYFILNGPKLSYFKKYGDIHPRGVINLIPGSWCKAIPQGTPRMSDAVAKSTRSGVISVNRCLAVHKPSNYAATLSALVASEGVADAFNSQTVALTNSQDSSRTFYMVASSEQERHAWTDAINENIDAYKNSQEALDTACGELRNILKAVGSNIPTEELPSILLAIYNRRATLLANL